MININNLSFKYDNKIIFEDINLTIPDNKIIILTGANGTGKTTLFKLIKGYLKVQNGNITNDFKKTFYLPQKINYPNGLTLFEYVTSYFYSNSFKWNITNEEKDLTMNILESLEIADKKDVYTEELSSGELQKANIATILLSDANCMLLDEPTSNMDLVNQIKTLNIIKKLKSKNITFVIILHDLNAAKTYGEYFLGITQNHKVFSGEKADFFTQENLHKIFGEDTSMINQYYSYLNASIGFNSEAL